MAKPDDRVLRPNLFFGMIGALCLAAGDWLMVFGDPRNQGGYFWLSEGAKTIPAWRNTLALAVGIPGVILCAMALLALDRALKPGRRRVTWRNLTVFSLLPWLTVHAFITIQLYTYGWMSRNGYEKAAAPTAIAVNQHYTWMALICYALISIPFLMWLIFGLSGRLRMPRYMGLVNPLIILPILVLLRPLVPDNAFKPGYINGEISTSFFLFFAGLYVYMRKNPAVEPRKKA